MKRILVFNAGSSSLKYKLFIIDNNEIKLEKHGEVDRIGTIAGPKNHTLALSILFQGFGRQEGFLSKIDNLVAIGHRVVHGGVKYRQVQIVTKDLINDLQGYNDLAPLHNPPIIEVMKDVFKNSGRAGHRDIPNYAVFDTGFYSELPEVAKVYPLPFYLLKDEGIKRYGFHGISHHHAYVTVKKMLGNKFNNMISIHLGAGSSVTAIKDGKAVDTSMGFTPLEGLMMSTRAGDLDPGIILYLMKKMKFNYDDLTNLLNRESGLKGISEISGDMKDLLYLAGYKVEDSKYQPSPRIATLPTIYQNKARLAIEMYIYRIKKYIGSYYAILGGMDVLVFTGKIGAGSGVIRDLVLTDLTHLTDDAKIMVVATDEELQIAREIAAICKI